MGSCVSVQKDPDSVSGSKNGKFAIPSSLKNNNGADSTKVAALPLDLHTSSPHHPAITNGSKEEMFFDSQPWLESDCEDDDFCSINGDFSPSRGNSPVHQSFSMDTTKANNEAIYTDGESVPAIEMSTSKKMKLSELLSKSLQGDSKDINTNAVNCENGVVSGKEDSSDETASVVVETPLPPYCSVQSVERSEDDEFKAVSKASSAKSTGQCCFPRLLSSHSFSEKRKKMASPACAGSS